MPARSALLTLLFCLLSVQATAQLELGAGFGIAFARQSIEPDDNKDYTFRVAPGVGVIWAYHLTDRLAIHSEPWYQPKGTNIDSVGFNFGFLDFDYIDLPVMLRYSFPVGKARPYVIGGVNAGYLLNVARKDVSGDEITVVNSSGAEIDLTERYGEWDLGIVFGAGVLVPAGEQLLMVEAHWVHGVVDLDSNTDSDLDMFNRGLIFRGGLLFPLAIRAGKPQPAP